MLQSAMTFLKKIRDNNNREWMQANKSLFEAGKAEFEEVVKKIINLLGKVDPDISSLEPRDCIFRQYRDIRFSKDKTPYKVHMGAYFNVGGKKINTAGYYFHLEPGGSLIAGGIYQPEAAPLKKVRQEIDYNLEEWESILNDPKIKRSFPSGLSGSASLSRPPKGYDEFNPAISYLKLKEFNLARKLSDEELLSPQLIKTIVADFKTLIPLVKFINRAFE